MEAVQEKINLKQYIKKKLSRDLLKNPSAWMLVFANTAVAASVIINNQNILFLLWAYWTQSVVIGVFNFVHILTLKDFSSEGFTIAGNKTPENQKISTAFFFLVHYGFFHLVYAIFLFSFSSTLGNGIPINFMFLLYSSAIFFCNYLAEFLFTKKSTEEKPNIGVLMFAPYKRIIPIHITIIFAGFATMLIPFSSSTPGIAVLICFTGLKTLIDLITH
jgi:hypothetical protein